MDIEFYYSLKIDTITNLILWQKAYLTDIFG
jgi:hypothetical protein